MVLGNGAIRCVRRMRPPYGGDRVRRHFWHSPREDTQAVAGFAIRTAHDASSEAVRVQPRVLRRSPRGKFGLDEGRRWPDERQNGALAGTDQARVDERPPVV
jgi:hypothetical protein